MNSYKQSYEKSGMRNAECDVCHSKAILYQGGTLTCRNCGHVIYKPKRRNKYNASPQIARDGRRRDSKLEAGVADELLMMKEEIRTRLNEVVGDEIVKSIVFR